MKRVLVFGMTENPGGVESFLMAYFRKIEKENLQFDFLCNTESVAYEDEILKSGGRVYKICARSVNFKKYRCELDGFFKAHASEYFAVWVNVCSLANIDYLKAAKKYGIPVRIIHSHNSQNMDSRLRGILHKLNRLFISKYATDFWACSKAAADWFYFKRIQKSSRYRTVTNAIDVRAFEFDRDKREHLRNELNLNGKFVLGNVGRLHSQKNQTFLLDVFKKVSEKDADAVLLIVGGGELEGELKAKAKALGIEKKVLFLGVRSDLQAIYSAMDIFVFPSLYEGLGIVLIEAQASGLYCLASDSVPRAAKVTENIEFIKTDSAEKWSEIISAHKNYVRTNCGNEICAAGYDTETRAKNLQETFNTLPERKYVITEIPKNIYNAGYKAKTDIRKVLCDGGFEPIDANEKFSFDKIPEFLKFLNKIRSIENGSEVVFQYPVYSFLSYKFFPTLLKEIKKKNLRLILLLHDVETARFYTDNSFFEREKEFFSLADKLIAHNDVMKSYLIDKFSIPEEKIECIRIFDYLCEGTPSKTFDRSIAIAGNLSREKSGYVYGLADLSLDLKLYGAGFDGAISQKVSYCGTFKPDELTQVMNASFGLVWDGNDINTCRGVTGEYLKINDPHKTSLYLACSMPVIIWSKAALSPFIKENGVGICVDDLYEAERIIKNMSDGEYAVLKQNAERIGEMIRSGSFVKDALKRAENK